MNKPHHFHKDVTDAQIDEHMRPHLEELMCHVVRRPQPEPKSEPKPKTESQSKSQPAPSHDTQTQRGEEQLSQTHLDFLESIRQDPNASVTNRRDLLGLTNASNTATKKLLLETALADAFPINLGPPTKRPVQMLWLTKAGFQALGKEPKNLCPPQVSQTHWWWQREIKRDFLFRGHTADIEFFLNGKRSDVAARLKDGSLHAYEVELSSRTVMHNLKDLEAGFDHVHICVPNTRLLKIIKPQIARYLSNKELEKVSVMLLYSFPFARDLAKKRST